MLNLSRCLIKQIKHVLLFLVLDGLPRTYLVYFLVTATENVKIVVADVRHELLFVAVLNCCLRVAEHGRIEANDCPFNFIVFWIFLLLLLVEILLAIFYHGQACKVLNILRHFRVPQSFEHLKRDASRHTAQEV